MIDNSRVVLEDNIEYLVVDKIKEKDFFYVYLANSNDLKDICIRKEIVEDGKCFLVGLDNEEEVDKALKIYLDKTKNNE